MVELNLNEIAKQTGLKKNNISKALSKAIEMKLVIKKDKKTYKFNKRYDVWRPLSGTIEKDKKLMKSMKPISRSNRAKDKKPRRKKKMTYNEILSLFEEQGKKKYLDYLDQGIVSLSDSYIIALNSCKIETAIIDTTGTNDLPRIIKAVLPIGYKEVTISKLSGSTVDWHYQYRPNIQRSSGSAIPTDLFLRDDYASFSGVLYSHSDIANRPKKIGDDLILIHNPKATQNAIPHHYFKLGIEYFVKLGQNDFSISWKDWREKS